MAQPLCNICLEIITSNPVFTPCIHGYHADCINRWLDEKKYDRVIPCPTCKYNIRQLLHSADGVDADADADGDADGVNADADEVGILNNINIEESDDEPEYVNRNNEVINIIELSNQLRNYINLSNNNPLNNNRLNINQLNSNQLNSNRNNENIDLQTLISRSILRSRYVSEEEDNILNRFNNYALIQLNNIANRISDSKQDVSDSKHDVSDSKHDDYKLNNVGEYKSNIDSGEFKSSYYISNRLNPNNTEEKRDSTLLAGPAAAADTPSAYNRIDAQPDAGPADAQPDTGPADAQTDNSLLNVLKLIDHRRKNM